jgi:hypothetical protein
MRRLFFISLILFQYCIYAQQTDYVIGPKFPLFGGYGVLVGCGQKYVVYFPSESYKSGMIEKVEFAFYKFFNKEDTLSMKLPVMLKIYARDTLTNIPGIELLKDTVIIFNQKNTKKMFVDVSQYNIVLPQGGIYCGLEAFSLKWYIEQGYLSADNLFYILKGFGKVFYNPMFVGMNNKKGIYKNYVLGGYACEWKDVTEMYSASLFIRLHIRE